MKPKLCWIIVILAISGVSWSDALTVTSSTASFFCCSCVCSVPLVSHFKHTGIWYYKTENKVKIILHFCFICLDHFLKIKLPYHQTTVNFFEKNEMPCRNVCQFVWLLLSASGVWLSNFEDSTVVLFIPFESLEWYNPYFQAFVVFFTYIIIFQVIHVLLHSIEVWTSSVYTKLTLFGVLKISTKFSFMVLVQFSTSTV